MSEYPEDAETRRQARGRQPVGPPNFPRRPASPAAPANPAAPRVPEFNAEGPPSHPYRPLISPSPEPRLLLRRAEGEEPADLPPFGRRQKGIDAPDDAAGFTRRTSSLDEPQRPRRLPSLLAGFSRRRLPPEQESFAPAPATPPPASAPDPLPPPGPGDSRFPMRRMSPVPYSPESGDAWRGFPGGMGKTAEPPRPPVAVSVRPVQRPVAPAPALLGQPSFLEAYRAAEARLPLKESAVEARRWHEAVFEDEPQDGPEPMPVADAADDAPAFETEPVAAWAGAIPLPEDRPAAEALPPEAAEDVRSALVEDAEPEPHASQIAAAVEPGLPEPQPATASDAPIQPTRGPAPFGAKADSIEAPASAESAESSEPLQRTAPQAAEFHGSPAGGEAATARDGFEGDRLMEPVSLAPAPEDKQEAAPRSEPLFFREFADEQEAVTELGIEPQEPAPLPDSELPLEDTKRLDWVPRREWSWQRSPEPDSVGEPFISAAEQSRRELFEVEAFLEQTRRMEWQPRRTRTWSQPAPEPAAEAPLAAPGELPEPEAFLEETRRLVNRPPAATAEQEEFLGETRRLGNNPRTATAETAVPAPNAASGERPEPEAFLPETRRLVKAQRTAPAEPEMRPEPTMMRNRDQDDTHEPRRLVLTQDGALSPAPGPLPHHSAEEDLPTPASAGAQGEEAVLARPAPMVAAVAEDAPAAAVPLRGFPVSHDETDDDDSSAPPSSRRLLKRLAVILVVLILLVLAFLAGWVGLLRHSLGANLPRLDGTEPVPGLHAAVTVERNAQGVPTLTAGSLDDLIFAEAYVTAGDRMWQMDGLRRHAAGELAAILGSSQVEHDRLQRVLGLRYTADKAVAAMSLEDRHTLEIYASGVNAWLAEHSGDLPMEFHLLSYKPEPWQPRDSVLVAMALFQDLSTEFPAKLARESLSAHLPPDLARDLYPVGSWRDHPPGEALPDLTSPKQVEEIPLDPTQSQLSPAPSANPVGLNELARLTRPCEGCLPGSNEWAVAGSKTASGKPLLSNDMHLGLNVPDIWYEARLKAPLGAGEPLDVEGFTLPGLPFVLVGRNQHLSWGITNLTGDVQDVRIEHLRGSGATTEFERADGSWAPAKVRTETIAVRGGLDQKLEVTTVTHTIGNGNAGETAVPSTQLETPVLTPVLKGETRALSLSWTALDPANLKLPFLEADSAHSGGDLVAAMGRLGGPPLNLAYADDTGLIGWHVVGRIPVRGPAVHHPRQVEQLILPPPEPGMVPSDEPASEPGEDTGPPAAKSAPRVQKESFSRASGRPRLMLAGFTKAPQAARRRAAAPARAPAARGRAAVPPVARSRRVPAVALRPSKPVPERRGPVPAEEEVSAPKQQPDYTIGSPIPVVPVDTLDANADWSGYIPYDGLPSVQNPATGFVATANSRVTSDDYPYQLATDWVDPYRTDRIVHMLARRKGLTPADMLHMELDVQSDMDQVMAERVAYALDHASAKALSVDKERLHEAADLLRRFDGNMAADSPAAAVEWTVRRRLPWMLIEAAIRQHDGSGTSADKAVTLTGLYLWHEDGSALENIVGHQPARWLPAGYASWNDFLAAEVEEALKWANAPSKLSGWRLGDVHKLSIEHPVLAMIPGLPRLLGISAGSGLRPIGGYRETVRASDPHFGSSERFTADMSAPMDSAGGAIANITAGESGNPRSTFYLDQMEAWFAGTTFPLASEAKHTLTLEPR